MQGKNAIIKSSQVIESKTLCPPPIRGFYLFEQINNIVRFSEIVLYIVIHCRNAQFYKLILERSGLLK